MRSKRNYFRLIFLIALERAFELLLSTRNATYLRAHGGIQVPERRYPFMVAFHSLFLVSCVSEVGWSRRSFSRRLGGIALIMSGLAQVLRYWAISTLGKRWNVRIWVQPGAGPITTGPYRWMKHPNYLAVVTEMVFLPLIHGAWVTSLVFSIGNALILKGRIRDEEEAMRAAYRTGS